MSKTARKAQPTHVLAISTAGQAADYYVAGTLTEVKTLYQNSIRPARGDRTALRQIESGMQLYKLNTQPVWAEIEATPSLKATVESFREKGLGAVGVDQGKITDTLKTVRDALKSEAPGLGRDLLGAAKGGMMEKLKLVGNASSLFSRVSGSVQELAATGKSAVETLQNRLIGYEGDGSVTPDGTKLVHATWLANPANAKPLGDLKILKDTPSRAAPKASPQ
jgi:hypothetical protein